MACRDTISRLSCRYVAWNVHETYKGKFDNLGKLTRFIKLAQSHDLLVILRPGPYICAEWEFGGFPYWLIKDKSIKVRTSEEHYIEAVENWLKSLFSVIRPLLYSNGGPVIMVQVIVVFLKKIREVQRVTCHKICFRNTLENLPEHIVGNIMVENTIYSKVAYIQGSHQVFFRNFSSFFWFCTSTDYMRERAKIFVSS